MSGIKHLQEGGTYRKVNSCLIFTNFVISPAGTQTITIPVVTLQNPTRRDFDYQGNTNIESARAAWRATTDTAESAVGKIRPRALKILSSCSGWFDAGAV